MALGMIGGTIFVPGLTKFEKMGQETHVFDKLVDISYDIE